MQLSKLFSIKHVFSYLNESCLLLLLLAVQTYLNSRSNLINGFKIHFFSNDHDMQLQNGIHLQFHVINIMSNNVGFKRHCYHFFQLQWLIYLNKGAVWTNVFVITWVISSHFPKAKLFY